MEKVKRVFLFESYEPSQRSTERFINKIGIPAKVEHCNNLFKAKEIAITENFDLVIVDVVHPGLNGLKVAEAFRANNSVVKIMITSPFHLSWLVQVCYNFKFNTFFSKQDEIEEYKNSIITLLNGKDYFPDRYQKDIHQNSYPEDHNFYRLPQELKLVYPLLVQGFDCDTIAKKLSLDVEEIKRQRDSIYTLTKVNTPSELIIFNYSIEFNSFRVFDNQYNYLY